VTSDDDDEAGEAGFEERRQEAETDGMSNAPKPDPWKSFRGVTAGTLILEAIVVLLALPVVAAIGGGLNAVALTYLLGLIAGFAIYPGVGVIGLIFTAVWALIVYVRSEVLRRERLGLLPGQEGPPD
jgi:hypothetical protein